MRARANPSGRIACELPFHQAVSTLWTTHFGTIELRCVCMNPIELAHHRPPLRKNCQNESSGAAALTTPPRGGVEDPSMPKRPSTSTDRAATAAQKRQSRAKTLKPLTGGLTHSRTPVGIAPEIQR